MTDDEKLEKVKSRKAIIVEAADRMSQPRRQQINTSKGSDMFLFGDDEHVRLSLIPTLIRIQCPLVFCSRRGIEVMEKIGRRISLCPLSTVPSRPMNRRRLCHRKTEIVVLYPVSLQTLNEVDILWNEARLPDKFGPNHSSKRRKDGDWPESYENGYASTVYRRTECD